MAIQENNFASKNTKASLALLLIATICFLWSSEPRSKHTSRENPTHL